MADVGDLVAHLGLQYEEFVQGLEISEHQMQHFGEIAAEVGKAVGLAFGIEKTIEAIHGQIEATAELIHQSQRLNIGVNSFQALGHEAALAHVSMSDLETGMEKLQKNITEAVLGNKDLSAAFGRLGIDAGSIIGMKADDQFMLMAEAIRQVGNDADRTDLVLKLLGRNGMALMNLILEGKVGWEEAQKYIHDTGLELSALDIERMEAAEKAIIHLGDTLKVLWRNIGEDISGPLSATAKTVDFLLHGVESQWGRLTPLGKKMEEEAKAKAESANPQHNSVAKT